MIDPSSNPVSVSPEGGASRIAGTWAAIIAVETVFCAETRRLFPCDVAIEFLDDRQAAAWRIRPSGHEWRAALNALQPAYRENILRHGVPAERVAAALRDLEGATLYAWLPEDVEISSWPLMRTIGQPGISRVKPLQELFASIADPRRAEQAISDAQSNSLLPSRAVFEAGIYATAARHLGLCHALPRP